MSFRKLLKITGMVCMGYVILMLAVVVFAALFDNPPSKRQTRYARHNSDQTASGQMESDQADFNLWADKLIAILPEKERLDWAKYRDDINWINGTVNGMLASQRASIEDLKKVAQKAGECIKSQGALFQETIKMTSDPLLQEELRQVHKDMVMNFVRIQAWAQSVIERNPE